MATNLDDETVFFETHDDAMETDEDRKHKREREIHEQADKLLQDYVWLYDTFSTMKPERIKLVGSVGRQPFSIDRAQAFHKLLLEEALRDAEGMVEPFMLKNQCD